jgi:hypothetical protein
MNVLLLKAWIAEQGPALIGSRLRQVRQYDERTLLLDLASEDGPRTLLMSVMEEYPALAVVSGPEFQPLEAYPEGHFAKALNFHLSGYTLYSIAQDGYDRSVVFRFFTKDIYGKDTLKRLRHELAGRASNAFLLSNRDMVVSIMKRVRREQNRVRHVITGKTLPPPPPLGKYVAAESGVEGLATELAGLAGEEGMEDLASMEHFFTKRVACCDTKLWPALEPLLPVSYDLETLQHFVSRLQNGEFTAELFGLGQEGRDANAVAFSVWQQARHRRGRPAAKPDLARERLQTRLDQLRQQRGLASRADELERLGLELLGQAEGLDAAGLAPAALRAWRDEQLDWGQYIALDKNAYDNAQELIRMAQRLRRGLDKLDAAIVDTEQQLTLAEQAAPLIARAAKPRNSETRLTKLGIKCLRFTSSDGLTILCGISDTSNDALLRAFNSGRHLWLHARDVPGSHVFVLEGAAHTPQLTLQEAAVIAAYHSQGRKEREVEVSYTPASQIRRPRDGKPGQVLKLSERVLSVNPGVYETMTLNVTRSGK